MTAADDDEASEDVAVKVLRPGIEAAFARDLESASSPWRRLAERTSQPKLRRFKPVEVVAVFRGHRADRDGPAHGSGGRLGAGRELRRRPAATSVPAVDWQRSSRRVLTLERVDRHSASTTATALIAAGHDLTEVLTKAASDLLQPGVPRRLLSRRPAPRQHVGRRRGQHRGRRLRHHGPPRPAARAATWPTCCWPPWRGTTAGWPRSTWRPATCRPARRIRRTFAQALRSVCEPIFGRPLNQDLLRAPAGPTAAIDRILRHAGPAPAPAACRRTC